MKRTAIASAIAVTVLSGSLIAGSASAASAANGAKSGGAEGVVTIIGSAIDIVGALNGPAVNTDLTVKNDTGYPIEIVGMSPPYKMQVTGPASGTVVPAGQAFQLGMQVERESGGRIDKDAGVSVVYRPIKGWTGSGFSGPYNKDKPVYGPQQGLTVKAIDYPDERSGLTAGYGMLVKIDGREVTAVGMAGRNVMPSLGVVSIT